MPTPGQQRSGSTRCLAAGVALAVVIGVLQACSVLSAAGSAAGTAASVAGSAVSTAASVAGSAARTTADVVSSGVRAATGSAEKAPAGAASEGAKP